MNWSSFWMGTSTLGFFVFLEKVVDAAAKNDNEALGGSLLFLLLQVIVFVLNLVNVMTPKETT